MKQHVHGKNKSLLVLIGTALSALALSGCGGDGMGSMGMGSPSATPTASATPSYGPPATGARNAQDVTFASQMIPHHAQAIEMASMALSRDTDADVKALAAQIKAAQEPEISALGGWLIGWGEPLPMTGSMPGMSGMSASDGMMTDAEMAQLDQATGAEFARMYLASMIKHHQGAVAMAKTELASGQNAQAKQMASMIVSAQEKEIATMKTLLTKLGG